MRERIQSFVDHLAVVRNTRRLQREMPRIVSTHRQLISDLTREHAGNAEQTSFMMIGDHLVFAQIGTDQTVVLQPSLSCTKAACEELQQLQLMRGRRTSHVEHVPNEWLIGSFSVWLSTRERHFHYSGNLYEASSYIAAAANGMLTDAVVPIAPSDLSKK